MNQRLHNILGALTFACVLFGASSAIAQNQPAWRYGAGARRAAGTRGLRRPMRIAHRSDSPEAIEASAHFAVAHDHIVARRHALAAVSLNLALDAMIRAHAPESEIAHVRLVVFRVAQRGGHQELARRTFTEVTTFLRERSQAALSREDFDGALDTLLQEQRLHESTGSLDDASLYEDTAQAFGGIAHQRRAAGDLRGSARALMDAGNSWVRAADVFLTSRAYAATPFNRAHYYFGDASYRFREAIQAFHEAGDEQGIREAARAMASIAGDSGTSAESARRRLGVRGR
jgi:hypothetical protein